MADPTTTPTFGRGDMPRDGHGLPVPAFWEYVAAMQKALEFYADRSSWAIKGGDDISAPSWTEVTIDGGDKAREALARHPR